MSIITLFQVTNKSFQYYSNILIYTQKLHNSKVKAWTLCSRAHIGIQSDVAFQAPMTIGKMFPFKDGTRKVEERSLVVYSLRCEKCDAQYIGKTERIVYHHMKEHRTKKDSSCFKHTQENPTHCFNTDRVEILDSADSDKKLKLKELMYINSRRPEINKQHGSQSKHEIKTLINATYPQFRPE